MIAISSASAAENATADDLTVGDVAVGEVAVNSVDEVVSDDTNDEKLLNNENPEVIASDAGDALSLDNTEETLSSTSPYSSDYSVEFEYPTTRINYYDGGKIYFDIDPNDESYYFDFYLKIYDNGDNEKYSKNIYSNNENDYDYCWEYYYPFELTDEIIQNYNLVPGTYTMKVINYQDEDEMDSATLIIDNTIRQGTISVSQTGNYYNKKTVTVTVNDLNTNDPLGNAKVLLTFSNGKTATVTTASNGKANYKVPFGAGTYKLTVSPYSQALQASSAKTTVKILQNFGEIKITQAGKYASNKKLTIKVRDKTTNSVVKNQKVILKFSNGKSTFVRTNSKGIATYYMKFNPGTYSVIASATNNNIKFSNAKLTGIKIAKTPVTLNPRPLVTSYASGKYFNIKVTDTSKKPVVGVKLKVNIFTGSNKKTINLKTVSTGWAKFGASKLDIGTHKVVVSVASTTLHVGSAKASTITVKKAGVLINAPKGTTNAYKQDGFYRARLTNYASGAALSGVTVTMKVYTGNTFKSFNVKTNANGVASISTKALSKGKHTVVVSYAGSNYLKPNTVKGAVTITNKIPTHFSYNGGLIFHAYQNWISQYSFISVATSVEVPVHLYDNNGNEIFKTVTVTHSSSGDSVTDESGQYFWITGGRPGSAILKFNGDSKYMPCTYSIDLGHDS